MVVKLTEGEGVRFGMRREMGCKVDGGGTEILNIKWKMECEIVRM